MTNQLSEPTQGIAGRYLTFALSKETYGVQISKVQEIISLMHITRVPGANPTIQGVINLRGKVIPVIDLRLAFGLPHAAYNERTCVIISEIRRGDSSATVGVIVDTVLEVLNYAAADIEKAPLYSDDIKSSFVTGIGRTTENTIAVLIDIENALAGVTLPRQTAGSEERSRT